MKNSAHKLMELRKKIDEIDEELATLLIKRFEIVREIAKIKVESNMKIEDKKREEEILEKIYKQTGKNEIIKKIFKVILKESKEAQKINLTKVK